MPKALIITTLLFLTALVAQAQEKKPPQAPKPLEEDDVVRITTELVQTDVMVFDKDGKFVPGLKPEQFQLLVDGKPQPILLFESVVTGTKNEAAVLKASRGNKDSKPTTEATSASDTSERGRTVLFFINDLHLAPGSLTRTHKTINNFIDNQLGPNDQVAITSASGQIGFLQQLTDNPAVLRAALDRLKFVPGGATDGERPYMSDYAAYLIVEKNDRTLFDYFVQTT
ncbi:MAG TPA: VWA domain-containing protein, partial [Pyrinomonadaceae bacterium]|nr:VWA domain-containing protein [Pyrinomonadaceae bacterium]